MVDSSGSQRVRFSLNIKLVLAFALITLLPLGLLAWLNDRDTRSILIDNANRSLSALASQTALSVDVFIESNLSAIRAEAQLPVLRDFLQFSPEQRRDSMQAQRIQQVLDSFKNKDIVYLSSYALFDRQGIDVADTDAADIGLDKSDRSYFREALKGLPHVTLLFSETTQKMSLYFSAPVRDEKGEIIGVLRCRYQIDILQRLVTQSGDLDAQSLFVILLDENHVRLADSTDSSLLLKSLAPLPLSQVQELQAIKRLPSGTPQELATNLVELDRALAQASVENPYFVAEMEPGLADTDLEWATFAPLRYQPWRVVLGQEGAAFLVAVERQRQRNLVLFFAFAGVAVVVAIGVAQMLTQPVIRLTAVARQVEAGNLAARAHVRTNDETGVLAAAFNDMTGQLQAAIEGLEQRVNQRTADLERRSRYLQASAEVGRIATSILDVDQLIEQVVQVVQERFGLYYVGLFLVDSTNTWAVLRAGTGEAGLKMLARQHRLKIGPDSMIGWCISHQQPRIALDVGEDAVRLATFELPLTRSEAALPLISRGQVLGALTVQSDQANAFDEASIAVLQLMADQVAAVLDNARLFAESQVALDAMNRAYGQMGQQAWLDMVRARPNWGYRAGLGGLRLMGDEVTPEMAESLRTGQVALSEADERGERSLAVPLKVRGQVIGALTVTRSADQGDWQTDQVNTLETLAAELGEAFDSARLYQDTQRRAAREQLTAQITARMRESLELDTVLQTAVREMGLSLDADVVEVRLGTGDDSVEAVQSEEVGR